MASNREHRRQLDQRAAPRVPAGRVIVSVYSSGAIGRLVPDGVIGLVKYVRDHELHEQAA